MAIMGFSDKFRFPEGMGMGVRYQMVADAVSPVFSEICARVMKELLQGL
jgi:site-specific DNA-cytosine methylase